jgi:methionine synthase I (cobalamin-dependent)
MAALARGPLIMDAAMGTRLCRMGLDLSTCDPCLWNLTHPDRVLDLHQRDVHAGSGALLTNTFGANRAWLGRYGQQGAAERINHAAVSLARQAAGSQGFVFGDIGPSAAGQPGAAGEQAAVLIEAGVDALCLETFRDPQVESVLLELRRSVGAPVPLLVSLWEWPRPMDDAARRLLDLGAAVLGINCSPGMRRALDISRGLAQITGCPLLVKPGANGGKRPDASFSPKSFAAAVPHLIEHNVRLLGGCCGTTHAHVRALAAACAPFRQPGDAQISGAAR